MYTVFCAVRLILRRGFDGIVLQVTLRRVVTKDIPPRAH